MKIIINFHCKDLPTNRIKTACGLMLGHDVVQNWVIPEKIHTPTTKGMLENLTGGGVNGSGNPDGRGALNLKIHPRG